jgi:hypothetical protein
MAAFRPHVKTTDLKPDISALFDSLRHDAGLEVFDAGSPNGARGALNIFKDILATEAA